MYTNALRVVEGFKSSDVHCNLLDQGSSANGGLWICHPVRKRLKQSIPKDNKDFKGEKKYIYIFKNFAK